MERSRSPSYPGIPLEQAIELIKQLHSKNRTNVIDRASAAKDMGYSGLTGRSLTILGALAQFNLVAKAGKGDLRVTPTAVDILYGIEEADRIAALKEAGRSPRLFRELFDRFPDGIPSENVIRSFLIQQGYSDAAIGPAIKSFVDTNRYLENAGVSDSHGERDDDGAESLASRSMEPTMSTTAPSSPSTLSPAALDAIANALAGTPLNKINMNIQGDQVTLSATLDYRGLGMLERKIAGLKALMIPDDDDDTDDKSIDDILG